MTKPAADGFFVSAWRERRIAAAFNAPIAAVTFTLEELIGDLDQTMLSGVIVAAALAAVCRAHCHGRESDLFTYRAH